MIEQDEAMNAQQAQTYLTTEELASRIKYDVRTIRTRLKDSVLLEGVHYIRPFGGRKLLFLWEVIQRDMTRASMGQAAEVELEVDSDPDAPSPQVVDDHDLRAHELMGSLGIAMAAGNSRHV